MTFANTPIAPFDVEKVGMHATTGLTTREYFAAMAMQGILANPQYDNSHEIDASVAVNSADALIAALNKETAQ